ncbi:hypothetical protein JYT35_00585 [Acidimicrobium ferrooxidans]|uniref:Uncharacterized protein n=1 Tax=Acidimicrobium ferrooxidans TaxID=53635 RepID=A0ABS3ATM9_9ACTN|nr:hypothetical protein [Acidimicrobium ferrooxidans]
MSRPVRVGATVDDDVTAQLDADGAELFWRHDLASALALISRDGVWDMLPEHGGGRRLTVEGISVGVFHLFVTADELDPRPDALVVYAVISGPMAFRNWPNRQEPPRSPARQMAHQPSRSDGVG